MPCETKRAADGITVILCHRGRGRVRQAMCDCCGKRPRTKLCDYPLQGRRAGQTCDRKMCATCAVHVGPDRDYCPPHAKLAGPLFEKRTP